jgi:hypothetical protein
MSQVHDAIALGALSVQDDEVQGALSPYIEDLVTSSWYPDMAAEVRKTNPEDARFLYPPAPKTGWQRKLERIALTHKFWTWCGEPPFNYVYLCGHYLRNAVDSLEAGDLKSAIKYCGVYSHVIADIIEPGHAVFDWALDIFAPVAVKDASGEIYTNKECLQGPVDIKGHRPRLLGRNIKQAEMAAAAALIKGSRFGAALAVPMEKALHSGKIKEARRLSSCAQNEAAKRFADFVHTACHLAEQGNKDSDHCLDLCKHPVVSAEISCYCRFRPLVDVFLDPSHFDTPHAIVGTRPLALLSEDGKKAEHVHGLCVMPGDIRYEATADYLLTPGAYSKFSARIGFNPTFKQSLSFISAVFSVRGDGRELAQSKPVRLGKVPVRLQAKLGRTRFLTLAMRYSRRLSSEEQEMVKRCTSAAHGVWAEPVLCSE